MEETCLYSDLSEIRSLLDAGHVTAVKLLELAGACHSGPGARLHAYQTWAPQTDQARSADERSGRGETHDPLAGIPVSVKDLFGVRDLPIWAGTSTALPPRWQQEGPVVAELRRQQAVITGKTHTVELAFGGLGINQHWGTPRNPWDPEVHRVPGGSSAGAGVSLCEGSAWLALGTDTAGSVRIPASMTGNVGLKTSHGRWSCQGVVPLSPTLDTVGILTRSVADAVYAFASLDPLLGDPQALLARCSKQRVANLRIGHGSEPLWHHCSTAIADAVSKTLAELETRGATLLEQHLPQAQTAVEMLQSGSVVSAECDEFIESELPEWRTLISPHLAMRLDDGANLSAREYLQRRRRLRDLAASTAIAFEAIDVLACPTVPITPPAVDQLTELHAYRDANLAVLSNTCVANYLGLCALTMPVALDPFGMPVGLQLLARHGAEEQLLAAALAIETVIGKPRQRIGRPPI